MTLRLCRMGDGQGSGMDTHGQRPSGPQRGGPGGGGPGRGGPGGGGPGRGGPGGGQVPESRSLSTTRLQATTLFYNIGFCTFFGFAPQISLNPSCLCNVI